MHLVFIISLVLSHNITEARFKGKSSITSCWSCWRKEWFDLSLAEKGMIGKIDFSFVLLPFLFLLTVVKLEGKYLSAGHKWGFTFTAQKQLLRAAVKIFDRHGFPEFWCQKKALQCRVLSYEKACYESKWNWEYVIFQQFLWFSKTKSLYIHLRALSMLRKEQLVIERIMVNTSPRNWTDKYLWLYSKIFVERRIHIMATTSCSLTIKPY